MSEVNRWGIAAIIAIVAVLPIGFVVAVLSQRDSPMSALAGMTVMVIAVFCGIIAAKRGSRWWLIVPVLAMLWACVVVLQMAVGE